MTERYAGVTDLDKYRRLKMLEAMISSYLDLIEGAEAEMVTLRQEMSDETSD